jgi:hypothetical protein
LQHALDRLAALDRFAAHRRLLDERLVEHIPGERGLA